MLQLILTADYEIFGDGSGCIKKCLISPAESLMQCCQSEGARITFFTDVCELIAFYKEKRRGSFPDDYHPADWIAEQLKNALRWGHDVQLHLHPQWLDYEYASPEQWKLNFGLWRLPKVSELMDNNKEAVRLESIFTQGRMILQDLLRPIDPAYECRAFRAGACCIQPEEGIITAMKNAGLVYDSSVIPMAKKNDGLTYYDYSSAPKDIPFWKVKNDINIPDKSGFITEVPIFSLDMGTIKRLLFYIYKRRSNIQPTPSGCKARSTRLPATSKRTDKWRNMRTHFFKRIKMFNFCNASLEEMKFFVKHARKRFTRIKNVYPVPIVAIGHPKEFGNPDDLKRFLTWIRRQPYIQLESIDSKSIWQRGPLEINRLSD